MRYVQFGYNRHWNRGDAICANDLTNPESPTSAWPSVSAARSRALRAVDWAGLLRRAFEEDVLACPCGGRRTVLALITNHDVAL